MSVGRQQKDKLRDLEDRMTSARPWLAYRTAGLIVLSLSTALLGAAEA